MDNTQRTNCYNAEDFYNKVKKAMNQTEKNYALVILDFDNFNYINDLFGYEKGDMTLSKMEECFSQRLKEGEIFSRIHADYFAFLVEDEEEKSLIDRFLKITDIKSAMTDILPMHYSLVCSGGIISIHRKNETIASLLDKVNFARKLAKKNYTTTFLYYDQYMDENLEWRKEITLMMEVALHDKEFEMYLQPKTLIKTGEVIGAEALVRWNNRKYGMLSPDQFIPILEQNGFVKQVDFYMLEEACRFLKKMIEQKMYVLPISVNFSKLHVHTDNFVEQVFEVVKRNEIPTNLIEIEFTENIIVENFQELINITSSLKYLGFKVSLDDFGKAYSSLNYLKDLPLDIIKIDREFLNSTTNTERGRLIIAKMVELIKSLRLVAVMEGVETEEQAEFLQKLSCDLGQGYLYARPMPQADYLEYLSKNRTVSFLEQDKNEEISNSLYVNDMPQEFQMDNWELYVLGQNIEIGLMKGYLDTQGTLQYINDCALKYFGYTRQEFREQFQNSIISFVHPDDLLSLKKIVQTLMKTEKPLTFQTRAIRKDGAIIYLQGNMSYVKDYYGNPIGIYCFQDVTEELERTKALHASEERYRFVLEQSDDIVFEWDFTTGFIDFSDKFEKVFEEALTQKWECNDIPLLKKIHPEDRKIFMQWVQNTYQKLGFQEAEFRIVNRDHKYLWIRSRSTAVCNERGEALKTIGVFSNIAKQKEEFNKLVAETQVDSLTKLYNKEEARRRVEELLKESPGDEAAFLIVDIDNFKEVNDSLGHQFGDTILQEIAQKIKRIFKDSDIIGRLGGDEIGIFMRDVDSEGIVRSRAELLNQVLRGTYFGTQTKYKISVSIGIALYPQQSQYFNELYQMADKALSESKKKGKDCYTIYHSEMEGFELENRTPLEGTERLLNSYFAEDIIFNTFEMLYETKDIQTTIRMILEQLGKRFQVDRVYIFEHSKDGKYISNTYEWCESGISSEKENLQQLSTEDFSPFLSRYDKEGILCCNDISSMDQLAFDTLYRQGICSFLQCGIYNEGKMVGFVGFDDCYKKRNWYGDEIAMLGYISRILSVFLIKNHTMRELLESYSHYVEMLDNLNGYVYVIDTKTYELLYLNKAMEELEANVGEKCYRVAFGCDTPCENCPAKRLSEKIPYATEEIYSVRVDRWVNSAASRVRWNGTREAALVCCTDISKYKQK